LIVNKIYVKKTMLVTLMNYTKVSATSNYLTACCLT
jgi:hypothetical protein